MLLLSLPTLLIALLGLANIAHSCRPSVWAIGLSANHTLDNHLRIVGRPISIQECRSQRRIRNQDPPGLLPQI